VYRALSQDGGIYFSPVLKQTKIEISHRGLSPCPLWEIIIKEKVNAVVLKETRLLRAST
jgi:hypothetical protein